MRILAPAAVVAALLLAPPAADARTCRPILDPAFVDGTRYEGSDVFRIRANLSCTIARRVARGATRKALGITPPPSGVKRFRYRAWSIVDDLRGASDRFSAYNDDAKVTWLFGDAR